MLTLASSSTAHSTFSVNVCTQCVQHAAHDKMRQAQVQGHKCKELITKLLAVSSTQNINVLVYCRSQNNLLYIIIREEKR